MCSILFCSMYNCILTQLICGQVVLKHEWRNVPDLSWIARSGSCLNNSVLSVSYPLTQHLRDSPLLANQSFASKVRVVCELRHHDEHFIFDMDKAFYCAIAREIDLRTFIVPYIRQKKRGFALFCRLDSVPFSHPFHFRPHCCALETELLRSAAHDFSVCCPAPHVAVWFYTRAELRPTKSVLLVTYLIILPFACHSLV